MSTEVKNKKISKEELIAIRNSVQSLCKDFPGEYWRKLDEKREYPTSFVNAMTESGFLAVLIPERYGGAGLGLEAACAILEEIHKNGCNAGACHAQGVRARSGSCRLNNHPFCNPQFALHQRVCQNQPFAVQPRFGQGTGSSLRT